jgi:hypothetical protein
MLLSQIVYDILNTVSKGVPADDTPYSERHLVYLINNTRALLIRSETEKGKEIAGNIVQNLKGVKVTREKSSLTECCSPNQCLYVTEKELPVPISTNSKTLFTYVGNDKGKSFQATSYQNINYDRSSSITKNMTRYFYLEKRIYIVAPRNESGLEYINIHGVFEDPHLANTFATCECENGVCDSSIEFEYPIKSDMLLNLKDMIVKRDVAYMNSFVNDSLNNTSPS